jgi:hypothetical protein
VRHAGMVVGRQAQGDHATRALFLRQELDLSTLFA